MERRNAREASDNRIAETLNRGSRAGGMSPKSKPLIGNKPGAGGIGAGGKKPGAAEAAPEAGSLGRAEAAPGQGPNLNRESSRPVLQNQAYPWQASGQRLHRPVSRSKGRRWGLKGRPAGNPRQQGTHYIEPDKGGTRYLGANFGKALTFGRDANNNFHARVLGVGYRKAQTVRRTRFLFPLCG